MSVITTLAGSSPPADSATHVLAAEGGTLASIEEWINDVFTPISDGLSEFVFAELTFGSISFPWIVGWLVLAATVFTIYFGFVQFRKFKLATEIVRGKYTRADEPGEINHFQALSSAVSGTVGLGNIAGVGVAVTIGGAGATFWMILAGLLGMCTKFVECTLGVKYRETHEDGTVSGGPMHYLRKGLAERFGGGFGAGLGKVLAVLAAIMLLFFALAGGNMFQANQTFAQLRDVTGGDDGFLGTDGAAFVFGVLLAVLVGAVIIGGIKSIGAVTSRLVPSMAVIYIAACLIVILVNITDVPAAIGDIVTGAFAPESVAGGAIGALIVGFQRAAFSNEAGLGSAPIAHSAVRTKNPITEGYVALLEPFIDTVVVCTMTALTIVIAKTQFWENAKQTVFEGGETPDGVTVTSESFATVLPWFPYVLTVAVALFALSTMITWGYYGQKAWTFLFGKSRTSERVYQVIFCLFIVAGSVLTLGSVLSFADAVLFLLALFNIIGLYLLVPVVKREVKDFAAKMRSGEVQKQEKVKS
ncbi:alanine/glycine:cation symporter family protein [Prauserella muralis]|uniref:D-alanine glycine permease n=1 Tax=Prauserella muralis TaxID=588067 RepID=A0A2V4BAI8_9PSEU|nr:alanine/glycine:cation symporter family protein [Prauserella muralis]PXY31522.1 D-alanine glycine permease [Prauserella muralis]TWE14129.1 AGCS family alanine or glycine:cation symporter [Prauserella muralis]